MNNPVVNNPNDFKVVEFHNPHDFTFTPEMGCMYDGRPISGITGAPGINGGESLTLPYHIAQQLAINLAKVALTKAAPSTDAAGIPTGVPLWDTVRLETMKSSYLTELYVEEKPRVMSETDRLMAKVEELKKFVIENVPAKSEETVSEEASAEEVAEEIGASAIPSTFQDKAEVIAELERLGIAHDKRKNKADLEKLLPVA